MPPTSDDERQHLATMRQTHERRLRILEQQRSAFGELHAPPHIAIEIVDLQAKIAEIDAKLGEQSTPAAQTPPPVSAAPQQQTAPAPHHADPAPPEEAAALTLRFAPGANAVQVLWEADVLGRRTSLLHLPYDDDTLPLVIKALDAAQYPNAAVRGPKFSPDEQSRLAALGLWAREQVAPDAHERVGRALYAALVADPEGAMALRSARDHATAQGVPLAYLLRFPPDAINLVALPWETLWDERGALLLSRGKLATCVRYLDLDQALPPPIPPDNTLRILAVAPHAGITDRVRDAERAARTGAWAGLLEAGVVTIEELSPATPATLVDRIQAGPAIDILHFYGHGRYQNGKGALLFDGGSDGTWIGADRLAALLGETRLVVLHACQSAMVGATNLLTGVAPALSASGVPAVVAMQLTVQSPAATRFAEVVYRSLARGDSLQRAVNLARQALYFEESDGVSWYVPTLTIRARDTEPLRLVQPRD